MTPAAMAPAAPRPRRNTIFAKIGKLCLELRAAVTRAAVTPAAVTPAAVTQAAVTPTAVSPAAVSPAAVTQAVSQQISRNRCCQTLF